MADYKVVAGDDVGIFKVEGLTQPILKIPVTFACDFDPADTDVEKLDKMTVAVHGVRHQYKTVRDGDTFDTAWGKLVVRGNHVVADDGTQQQMAAAQGNVNTPGHTLAQVCQQAGITLPPQLQSIANTPVGQIPWGTIAAPPHMKGLFAPPLSAQGPSSSQTNPLGVPGLTAPPHLALPHVASAPVASTGLGSLVKKTSALAGSFYAIDQSGQTITGQLNVNPTDTNQAVVDEFDNYIQQAFGSGNLKTAITYPTGKRVLEVTYNNDTLRVVLELN